MDKERKAHEALLQAINTSARSTPIADDRQLKFLRDLETQTLSAPYGSATSLQLVQLLADETLKGNGSNGDSFNLNAWLFWLNELLLSRKHLLGDTQPLLEWLLQRIESKQGTANDLRCLRTLLESLPAAEARKLLPRLATIKPPSSLEEALLLILCQDSLLGSVLAANIEMQEQELQLNSQLAKTLLQPHYDGTWNRAATTRKLTTSEQEQFVLLVAHTLQLLQKLTAQNMECAMKQAPELLGFALANIRYRAEEQQLGAILHVPHRVQPAQQSSGYELDVDDLPAVSNPNAGSAGRRAKARKLRSLTKRMSGKPQDNANAAESTPGNGDRLQQLLLQGFSDNGFRTHGSGDSDGAYTPASDSTSQQLVAQKQQRQSQVKIRLGALHLVNAVTKLLPRRTLYGYWHALFPNGSESGAVCEAKSHLLYIGANDGNMRCRALALQVAAQLLYGSKPYLSQASCTSARINYTPFALSLASSILETYRQLTGILEREYAPPVLSQCLKCLAVLVQATPFEQLEMGFVYEFVPQVKNLARHVDTTVKVSALLVMEMLIAPPRLTQEVACAVGMPISERRVTNSDDKATRLNANGSEMCQHFQQFCDSEEEEEELEQEQGQDEKVKLENQLNLNNTWKPWPHIPRNSWLLRLVLRYINYPLSAPPLRVESLQVILAMATHFTLLREHLARLSSVLCKAFKDPSMDVRLYGARCLDAIGYHMARYAFEQTTANNELESMPHIHIDSEFEQQHLAFWLHMLPAIYAAFMEEGPVPFRTSLCDALSNMGSYTFERLPQPQRNGLLAFLLGCSSDDCTNRQVRAAALRALAVYVLHPTLRNDLVYVEHAAELTLRLSGDSMLNVRIKAIWALGNISEALVANSQSVPVTADKDKPVQERISLSLLSRLIETSVLSCNDHDKVRANAVRALGNLLRLLPAEEHALMQRAVSKLLDCVRASGSAKVKWNACYAIGNLARSRAIFSAGATSANTLFTSLCQLIVQHANFKVRINATAVLLQIEQRADFGTHYVAVWRSLLAAVQRSHDLDTFEEYNHRDGLQQQLCLAMAYMLARARPDDLVTCLNALEDNLDVVKETWRRVAYRILPEQAAPLFTCSSLLKQRFDGTALTGEQRNALTFLANTLRLEG